MEEEIKLLGKFIDPWAGQKDEGDDPKKNVVGRVMAAPQRDVQFHGCKDHGTGRITVPRVDLNKSENVGIR